MRSYSSCPFLCALDQGSILRYSIIGQKLIGYVGGVQGHRTCVVSNLEAQDERLFLGSTFRQRQRMLVIETFKYIRSYKAKFCGHSLYG